MFRLEEGREKKGGVNPPPTTPKPNFHPPAQKSNNYFKLSDIESCAMSKEEMWKTLNGKTVKCIHTQDGDFHMFAVQDLESKKVYMLDNSR
jgi:hypothetical protein